jgi:8-oxo-dGTP pyrophosphatase MutT (NUDIX family)
MAPDESPADAVVREAWEETGLLVEPLCVLGVYGGPEFHVTYPNGDELSCLGTAFECRVAGGSLRPDLHEVAELGYFSQAEAAGLGMSPLQYTILADAFGDRAIGGTKFKLPTWQPPADGVRTGGMSDYLRSLREQVGHDLLLMPAVGAIIRDGEGCVLLQQRADNGQWHPPAGALEPHEHPADAVVREVWEETGLLVEPLRVTGVYGGSDFHGTCPNGDRIAVYSVMFECRVVGGEASPDGIEVAALGYFAPEELTEGFLLKRWQQRVFDALDGWDTAAFDPPAWRPPAM